MNHGIHRFFTLCMAIVLLLTACQPKTKAFVPVTGVKETTPPKTVQQARANVLGYVLSSARLDALPSDADWQLELSPGVENQYRFRSGDWLMLIWLAEDNQRVMIFNKAENASWTGYVTADGQVVDTAYGR